LPAAMMLSLGLSAWLVDALGVDRSDPARLDGATASALWFAILINAVGPALIEELFCRGFLGRGLVGRYGVLLGVLLTSVIFAVMHSDIPHMALAFVLGVYLHLAYLATRSLWVPVLLHFLTNASVELLTRDAA